LGEIEIVMAVIKAYKYLFYKLFKFWEFVSVPKFWSDIKAAISIDVLIFFTILSLIIYYNIFIDPYFNLDKNKYVVLLFILAICGPNYYIFHRDDKWKRIVYDFDRLSSKKNKVGSIIVLMVILLIIGNLILAFYLMSQVNWKQYR